MTFADPLVIARAHQKQAHALTVKIQAEAGCIRQLMVGRTVIRKEDGIEFEVREARLGLGSHVSLFGRRTTAQAKTGHKRMVRIGLVSDIELVPARSDTMLEAQAIR